MIFSKNNYEEWCMVLINLFKGGILSSRPVPDVVN